MIAAPMDTLLNDFEALFLEHLDLIDRVADSVSRRSRFPKEDREDFKQWVKMRIVKDDYAVLRKFKGRCSFGVYLTNVVHYRFQDYRNHLWGKYRPTEKARRLGDEAVALELRIVRDGMTLSEAIEDLLQRGAQAERADLEELAAQLPVRVQRRQVDEILLEQIGVDGDVAREIEDRERDSLLGDVRKALDRALDELSKEDRILLRMHYEEGVKISLLARSWEVSQRSLYTRRDRCLRHLRRALKEAGLEWDAVRNLIGWEKLEF